MESLESAVKNSLKLLLVVVLLPLLVMSQLLLAVLVTPVKLESKMLMVLTKVWLF